MSGCVILSVLKENTIMNQNPTTHSVYSFRKQGVKVRVTHRRLHRFFTGNKIVEKLLGKHEVAGYNKKNWQFLGYNSHGGETQVDLTFPDGSNFTGLAQCLETEPFVRTYGIDKAIGRALSAKEKLAESLANVPV